MEMVYEIHQVLRRTVVAGRRKVACRLIPPGTKKWMVRERKKFHMRETHLGE